MSGVLAGVVLIAAGTFSTLSTGGAVGSLLLLGVGVIILVVVVADFPVSSVFDRDGVSRRPILRRHRLTWDRVDRLTRTRPSIAARARNTAPGGLVAKVGRRRYLLVDQCESIGEYDALVELLTGHADRLGLDELVMPPPGVDPTYTYRRRKWQNPSAPD